MRRNTVLIKCCSQEQAITSGSSRWSLTLTFTVSNTPFPLSSSAEALGIHAPFRFPPDTGNLELLRVVVSCVVKNRAET